MSEVRVVEDGGDLTIDNGSVTVTVHLERGAFDIVERNGVAVRDAEVAVTATTGGRWSSRDAGFVFTGAVTPLSNAGGKGVEVLLWRESVDEELDVGLSIAVYESPPHVLLRACLQNDMEPFLLQSFEPLSGGRIEMPGEPGSWRFYKQGWQSWSPTLVLPVSGEDDPVAPPLYAPGTTVEAMPGRFVSDMMTAVADPESQRGVIAGFVTSADQFSQVWLDRGSAELSTASYADGLTVELDQTLASETLLVELTDEPLRALERYGDVLGEEMTALPFEEVASGWCSWYRYFTEVTEEHVLSNLDDLAARKDDVPVKYVQLDDGYQADIGDWLTVNEKFPHGLKWLVERIHERGYEAGLWLAPFLAGANSQLYKDHPEWVVQHKPGTPYIAMLNWGQANYALDLSRDDVIDWLRHVFTTVTQEWGFDYVKIDFVYAGAVDCIRANDGMTRAQLYRRGLQTIRDSVGDRFILGCGDPIGPTIGLVNGSRIGPDVAPFWHPTPFEPIPQRNAMAEPSALNSIRNTITRFWMHGRLWQNDPDCLLVRDSETLLTADEVRTLTTVIGMTGGMVLDSDDLTALPDERREMISMLLPVYGKSAIPTDLFTSDMPRVLELDCGSHRMIALFNWSEAVAAVDARLAKRSHVFDVWDERYLGAHDDSIALLVPAHGCRLLAVRQVQDRPHVVGTTFHLLQGACEIASESWSDGALRVSMKPVAVKRGALHVWFPAGVQPSEIEGVEATLSEAGDGVWAVTFDVREPLDLVIRTEP